ncbi:MAG: radical SAM family heme chaperone HemW [Burkholderiales bacterium]
MLTTTLIPFSTSGIHFTALPPLSLYIHIPWCVKKCPYCDFNSHEVKGAHPEKQYVAALIHDLEQAIPQIYGRKVHSVFFGGGTPSLLSAAALDDILAAVRALVRPEPNAEITLEANPGTFEAEKFSAYAKSGINRLSIGIQSFNPMHLKALGRIHDDQEARRSVDIAKQDFENFNFDIMYALPNQTLDEALQDIDTALSFKPPHLSAYHLTLEPNTLFYRHPPKLPNDDAAADMQQAIERKLRDAGYENYETSAFAETDRRSKHNLNYWQFGDYLGIGAGAHSKISNKNNVLRMMRRKHPQTYMDTVARAEHVQEEHDVSRNELPFEFMMNALRLREGFAVPLFRERTSLPLSMVEKELREAEAQGLIERDYLNIKPTEKGRLFLNDLLQIFLREK